MTIEQGKMTTVNEYNINPTICKDEKLYGCNALKYSIDEVEYYSKMRSLYVISIFLFIVSSMLLFINKPIPGGIFLIIIVIITLLFILTNYNTFNEMVDTIKEYSTVFIKF